MKRRKRRKSRILEKVMTYAAMFLAGEMLLGTGGYFCIMTHLPDAVGIPLMTAGFFLIVVLSCSLQEEYDRFISRKYSGRPIYKVERARKKNGEGLRGSGRRTRKMERRGLRRGYLCTGIFPDA